MRGIRRGTATLTTYHHEQDGQTGTYNILVNGVTKATAVSHSTGPNGPMTSATFMFHTNPEREYVVTLQYTAGSYTLINGFELSVVPPPGTVFLIR